MNIEKKCWLYFDKQPLCYSYVDRDTLEVLYTGEGLDGRDRIYKEYYLLEKGKFTNKNLQKRYNEDKNSIIIIIRKTWKVNLPKKALQTSKVKQLYKSIIRRFESKLIDEERPPYNIMQTSEKYQMAL